MIVIIKKPNGEVLTYDNVDSIRFIPNAENDPFQAFLRMEYKDKIIPLWFDREEMGVDSGVRITVFSDAGNEIREHTW